MNQAPTLSRAEILQIHEAAVEAGLPASRGALLAGLDPAFVASLSVAPSPAAQCLSDLHELASAGSLRDGTIPLAVWLQNAVTLAGPRPSAQVFKDALARIEPRDREAEPSLRRAGIEDREDRFLAQVERICRLRQPSATISRLRAPPPFAGALEVSHVQGPILVIELVGALEHPISEEALAVFAREVDASYRTSAPSLRTTLVHGGLAAPAELAQRAYRQGILLTTYTEYQGLIDFGRYLEGQTRRLEADLVYPPSLYVEQPARVSIGGREETATASALRSLWELLESPHPRFALILGDFGAGKTFLLHELARRMATDKHPLVPVLVEMRALEKQRSLGALIAQHFASADVGRIDVDAFRYMLAEGRIALLFDGFDELALRLTYDRALEHFDTLIEAAKGSAKVVITSRTQHFLTDGQVKRALAERAEQLPGYRLVTVQPFGPPQIRQFLVNRLQDECEADARLALLDEVKDLLGLSKVPRLLGFIADIEPDKLEAAKQQAGEITAAKLYEVLIDRWLDGEHKRLNPSGAPHGVPRAGLRAAVTEIAMLLWGQTARTLTEDDLRAIAVPGARTIDASVLAHQLGSGSLLVRDAEGAFSFLHQSVLEWLVADAAARELARGAEPAALRADAMSDLMADFFASLATPEAARGWAGRILHGGEAGHAKDNALRVLQRLAWGEVKEAITNHDTEVVEGPNLAGQDLAGRDLTGADLRKADLARADLRGATLVGARLEGASLAGARLERADLQGADLQGADLRDADLSFARLLGADLREVKGPLASLRAAKLVGAKTGSLSPEALSVLEADGAAPPAPLRVEPMVGPASACNAVAWSPQGDWLVTGHDDGTVRIWDAVTGQALRALSGHTGSVESVAFSPDGLAIASGSKDKTVRLWEVSTGRATHTFEGHSNRVLSVAFNPDNKMLASGSEDKTIHLWEMSTGRTLRTFKGHTSGVRSVAFSPNGKMLASGAWDMTIQLWEVSTGHSLRTLHGHLYGVLSVVFGPDGQTLASGSLDKTVRLWDVSTGRMLRTIEGHMHGIWSVVFGPDGQTLASSSSDKTVRLWDASSGHALRTFQGHTDRVRSVVFGPDGQTLASGSLDKTVRLWDVSSGRALRTFQDHTGRFLSVAFGPDGKTLASGSEDKTIRLWEVSSGRSLRAFEGHMRTVWSLAFGPDGKTLASGSWDNTMRLWEVSSGRSLRTFEGHTNLVQSVAFGPEGKTLASGSWDSTVRLWEVSSGRALHTCKGHRTAILSVAFGPEGKTLASGSLDTTVRLWDVDSGRLLRTFEGHAKAVQSVAFGPEGKTLVSGSEDTTVRLWDVDSGRALRTFEGHARTVQNVAFGPEGKTLASGSDDKTVRLWDIATGRLLRTFEDHLGPVQQVAFHPHGRFLASAGADGIRLWDIAAGTCLATLLSTPEGWAAFTPDGHYKLGGDIAGSFWHVIGLCRFEPGELDPYLPAPLLLPDDAPLVPLP